ncbi:MAG: hypothetical protein HC866_12295 [Leptolyngbyaceae cyanobacterium RU_5_1]|nr:hypothetical protein [Leptolyngbyaceae cyanobacterium RU_5_1]
MSRVLIIVEPANESPSPFAMSSTTVQGVSALKQAMLDRVLDKPLDQSVVKPAIAAPLTDLAWASSVEMVFAPELNQQGRFSNLAAQDYLICPLTLNLPDWIPFPAQAVFKACGDVERLRQTVAQWQFEPGVGNYWLPIVLTHKGPLYAEVIGIANDLNPQDALLAGRYVQPVHLTDSWRQPLYELGQRLLRSLTAPPAVYLIQFGLGTQGIYFDQLLPFPDAPAIASIDVQSPDLFACHWRCLTGQPVRDLLI